MGTLVYSAIEGYNDGDALVLYFVTTPTKKEIGDAAKSCRGKYNIGVLGDPQWEIQETPVSIRAGLVRVVVTNVG